MYLQNYTITSPYWRHADFQKPMLGPRPLVALHAPRHLCWPLDGKDRTGRWQRQLTVTPSVPQLQTATATKTVEKRHQLQEKLHLEPKQITKRHSWRCVCGSRMPSAYLAVGIWGTTQSGHWMVSVRNHGLFDLSKDLIQRAARISWINSNKLETSGLKWTTYDHLTTNDPHQGAPTLAIQLHLSWRVVGEKIMPCVTMPSHNVVKELHQVIHQHRILWFGHCLRKTCHVTHVTQKLLEHSRISCVLLVWLQWQTTSQPAHSFKTIYFKPGFSLCYHFLYPKSPKQIAPATHLTTGQVAILKDSK